jgi:hypothetical protein
MADHQGKRQHGIESLLAERKKYETWMHQLEDKRASSAEHVFARVHADYAKRLEEVRERLRAEAEGIKSLVGQFEERLAAEQRAATERTDERAELELRAAVGEFSEKEWNATRAKLDQTIAELRAKSEATERELGEMKETLRGVSGAPSAPSAPAALAPEPIAAEPVAAEPEASAPSPPRKATPFDELAFLKSIAGTPATPLPSLAKPVPEPEPAAQPSAEAEPKPVPEAEPEAAPPRARASSRAPSQEPSELGAPTPRTSQAIRSLKCQECGTLNFPTEWYCERCGGELAAF